MAKAGSTINAVKFHLARKGVALAVKNGIHLITAPTVRKDGKFFIDGVEVPEVLARMADRVRV